MYEVTYSINGVIKKININGNDALTIQNIVTNMFSGQKIDIIDIRRK